MTKKIYLEPLKSLPDPSISYYSLAIAVKKYAKLISNFPDSVLFYWISLFCCKYFVRDCLSKQIFD